MKILQGELQAKGLKYAIVVSRFNDFITSKLLEGALDALIRHGAKEEDVDVVNVPGIQHGEVRDARFSPLTDSLELVDQLLTQVRTLALDLRPSILDDLGLVPAHRWYANRQAARNGWILSLAVEGMDGRIPIPMEVTCFRVAQEALTNIAKYSQAKVIDLTLRRQGGDVTLVIQDDGVGFDVILARRRAQSGESIGLLGMEERARLAGGSLVISSVPGEGTRLELSFSLAEQELIKPHVPTDGDSAMSHIRLLIVEDHALVRAGMKALLQKVEGIQVVADMGDGIVTARV